MNTFVKHNDINVIKAFIGQKAQLIGNLKRKLKVKFE